MGTTFDPKQSFLGAPLLAYRDLLRRWIRYQDVEQAVANKKLGLSPQAAAALINEAEIAGLFMGGKLGQHDPFKSPLTDKGRGFLAASPVKSMPRDKAAPLIDEILRNCAAINSRDDLCFRVDRIWLFGSYVKGAQSVNDIDISIEYGRIPGRSITDRGWGRKTVELACAMAGENAASRGLAYPAEADIYLENKLTYGPRKHPRLSPTSITDLKDLACECRMIFDRSRGGPVDDPVLPKHPDSRKRSERMHARTVMPKLSPSEISTPVRIELTSIPTCMFETLDDRLVHPHRLATRPDLLKNDKFQTWRSSIAGCDGRERGLSVHRTYDDPWARDNEPPPYAAVVERKIATCGSHVNCTIKISDVFLGGRRTFPPEAQATLAAHIVMTAGCDIESIIRKSDAAMPSISIDIVSGHPSADGIRKLAAAEVESLRTFRLNSNASWLSETVRLKLANGDIFIDDKRAHENEPAPFSM